MKTIKINFSGMGGDFNVDNNFIVNILKKKYDVKICDSPDYLFYSVNSKDYLDYSCVRIFYTAENLVPDFNICDYAIGFHYLDFGDRYFRYPLYLVDSFNAYANDNYALDLERALCKHKNSDQVFEKKSDFCSFVYSNGDAAKCREEFFEILSTYKQVNSGGRYRNNIGGPIESKLEFQLKHKFAIAFENTSTPGYTTEKLVHAFSAHTIPIYWGDPEISKVFNPKSFINCHEYGVTSDNINENKEAFQKIIEKIIELDENKEQYLAMLNEPAFNHTYSVYSEQQKFEKFLFSIFDQELDVAYRRNRYYWGERYERKQRIGNQVYWLLRKGLPLRDFIKSNLIFTKGL